GGAGSENQAPTFPSTNPWENTNDENDGSGRTRSSSVRRKSEVPRLVGSTNRPADSIPPPPAPASTSTATRIRRQSLVQSTNAAGATSRAPRKSVGSGSYPASLSARRPSLSSRKASADTVRTEQTNVPRRSRTQ